MTPEHCAGCPAYIKSECIGVALYCGRSGGRKPAYQMDFCPRDEKDKKEKAEREARG